MQSEQSLRMSRRMFSSLTAGMAIAAFFSQAKQIRTCLTTIFHGLENVIMDRSMPLKSPGIDCVAKGDAAVFFRKGDEKPFFATNLPGKWIWDACDGKTSPMAISCKIHKTCDVSRHRVHQDCLAFLRQLKRKGLVRV